MGLTRRARCRPHAGGGLVAGTFTAGGRQFFTCDASTGYGPTGYGSVNSTSGGCAANTACASATQGSPYCIPVAALASTYDMRLVLNAYFSQCGQPSADQFQKGILAYGNAEGACTANADCVALGHANDVCLVFGACATLATCT